MKATTDIRLPVCIAILAISMSSGCSSEKPIDPTSAIASGIATLDGNPITGGMITILSDEKPLRRATGVIRPDGTFRLAGSPLGSCRVVIDTTSLQAGDPSSYMPVPVKYHTPTTTDLSINLQPGPNDDIAIRCVSGNR